VIPNTLASFLGATAASDGAGSAFVARDGAFLMMRVTTRQRTTTSPIL